MPDRYGNRRVGFAPALRQGTGRSTIDRQIPNEHRSVLVAAQVAGSFRLLIVAGLFLRSLQSVQHAKSWFRPTQVLDVALDPGEIGYSPVQTRDFYRQLLARTRALPGVETASLAMTPPLGT